MRLPTWMVVLLLTSSAWAAQEVICERRFTDSSLRDCFENTWGDRPAAVLTNGVEMLPDENRPAYHLKLRYPDKLEHDLSYWTVRFDEPVPIASELEEIAFRVRSNVPVAIKIPISPFGFIYHGPRAPASTEWRTVRVSNAFHELSAWCARGMQDARNGSVPGVILAVSGIRGKTADVWIERVWTSGPTGARGAVARERKRRRFRRVRVSVVTLPWSDEGRSLETVLDRLDEAGAGAHSDIVCLPMECVKTDGEPIPGPISRAIAAKAKEYRMYVIGNIRERDGNETYVTSFLCDRDGRIVGKYRKSHKFPDEDMDLGDDLPVFKTDIVPIAMRIGSDRYFPEIDHVYTAKGARIIFWSQEPEPVEDEYLQDFPSAGRASDYRVFIACARYSYADAGWITNHFPPYRGCPIGRSYIVNREGQRIACTTRKGKVATAVIPLSELIPKGRGPDRRKAFAAITEPVHVPPKKAWAKRRIRVTAIENHIGIDDLLRKLDEAGRIGSDIVCTYEFVWIPVHGPKPGAERIAELERRAAEWRGRVAAKARQWHMYVVLCGVIDRREVNEAVIYGRDGREIGRYRKIGTTYPEQIPGTETPVFETDFGRIAVKICADQSMVEIDRCYAIEGADIVFFSTQDWGPDALWRNLRDISRTMDGQFFHVQATHSTSEVMHRSVIIDPCGVPVVRSRYLAPGIVSAVIDLDNDRPRRYVRKYTPYKPHGYLPQYQSTRIPETRNDLREVILRQRRPELYSVLAPEPAAKTPVR